MIGTAVIDVEWELEGFDFTSARRWHVLVLSGSRPSARVDLPSPGPTSGDALARAALVRRADAERARWGLADGLRARLADGHSRVPVARIAGTRASLGVSVIVCTHRRPHYLPALLEGLRELSPAPFEILIVDNDPGSEDCRAEVERAGFRYLREDRRGLDNARNAGLRAARGDVVLYTDDDCVPPRGWLAPIDGAFSNESVVAVTGPAFPYVLDTPARVRMENQASLARGLARVSFDWQVISPLHAAAMGVGANMAIRREGLLELGAAPFPAELDAGTETESGGDTYVLSRLLARGHRVIYDPDMFTFHRHRPDGPALHRALLGYGIGLSAALTKLLVEEHELTVPRAWVWLVKQYWQTQRRRMVGRADAIETRLSWEYLRGGFLGTGRWRAALRTQAKLASAGHALASAVPEPVPVLVSSPTKATLTHIVERASLAGIAGGVGVADATSRRRAMEPAEPRVSVIIPTFKREQVLERCLSALAQQDVSSADFEVIVVDDAAEHDRSPASTEISYPFPLRRVSSGGLGAAGARNVGARDAQAPMLLFLDDDVVGDPWLVRRHLQWHEIHDVPAALVGSYRPRPPRCNFAAAIARMWWQEMFQLLEDAYSSTFVGALTANLSLPRAVFHGIGGFSEEFARERREDWEWGLRLLGAGIPLAYEPAASARHEFGLSTTQRLRDAQREGVGDTIIAARYPVALPSLPLVHHRPQRPREPIRWFGFRLWRSPRVRRLTIWTLNMLERGKLRSTWVRLFRLAQSAAYAQGAREGGWGARGAHGQENARAAAQAGVVGETSTFDIELLSRESIPVPSVAVPLVRVTLGGAEVARVLPNEGIWGPGLADQIIDAVPPEVVSRAAVMGGWLEEESEVHSHGAEVEVIFGPANPPSDLVHRGELEQHGALVQIAPGDPREHWSAVASAARASSRALVAIPLPGTSPASRWLAESLSAFDGERVGLVFGGRVEKDDPAEPLYLHDRESTDVSLLMGGDGPAYLVARRELAVGLQATGDMLGPIMEIFGRALREDWVIGHRSVRGLECPAYQDSERGEAYGRLEVRQLARSANEAGGAGWAGLAGGALLRGLLVLGWQALKGRGRLLPLQRQLAKGVVKGAWATILARSWRADAQS